MLFNEPKLLKCSAAGAQSNRESVSVLFNEPKLLKCEKPVFEVVRARRFSALQRAEIAEIERL